jgi:hypothetical protein
MTIDDKTLVGNAWLHRLRREVHHDIADASKKSGVNEGWLIKFV